jgi:ribosomal protein L22
MIHETRALIKCVIVTGRFSDGIVREINDHIKGQSLNDDHPVLYEIAAMEGARPSKTKAAMQFERPPLRGLWHKHFGNQWTGQWLVFARHDETNYYLTLGLHGDDEEIWKRCRACAHEFGELKILRA